MTLSAFLISGAWTSLCIHDRILIGKVPISSAAASRLSRVPPLSCVFVPTAPCEEDLPSPSDSGSLMVRLQSDDATLRVWIVLDKSNKLGVSSCLMG